MLEAGRWQAIKYVLRWGQVSRYHSDHTIRSAAFGSKASIKLSRNWFVCTLVFTQSSVTQGTIFENILMRRELYSIPFSQLLATSLNVKTLKRAEK